MATIAVTSFAAIGAEESDIPFPTYNLSIDIDGATYGVTVDASIIYYNREGVPLNDIRMTLYPNAYRSVDTAPIISSLEDCYPGGFVPGGLRLLSVSLPYEVVGDTTLVITPETPLAPGESLTIEMKYSIDIPETQNRMGQYNGVLSLGNSLPYIGVFDEGEWALYPYYSRGDPFYSEVATWHVEVSMDEGWELGSTGTVATESHEGGRITYSIDAELSRDFALSCSPYYETYEERNGDTLIRSLYLSGNESGGREAARIAKRALTLFERIIGDYPYDTLTLAMTHLGGAAGMEYPQLVFLDAPYYAEELATYFETTIVHEVAHQWWYGVVGNDQVAAPVIDESLAQFMTLLYYEEYYPSATEGSFKEYLSATYHTASERIEDDIAARALMEYPSNTEYVLMTYYKGPLVLDTMRWATGHDAFISYLSMLYETHAYGTISVQDMLESYDAAIGNETLADIFEKAFLTAELPDVSAGGAQWDGDTITFLPNVPEGMAYEVLVHYEDGSTELFQGTGAQHSVMGKTPATYDLDPYDKILESDEQNNSGTFKEGDKSDDDRMAFIIAAFALIVVCTAGAYLMKKRR
jgi:hypothetical protein